MSGFSAQRRLLLWSSSFGGLFGSVGSSACSVFGSSGCIFSSVNSSASSRSGLRSSASSGRSGTSSSLNSWCGNWCWRRSWSSHWCRCGRRGCSLFFFAACGQSDCSNHSCQYERFVHLKDLDNFKNCVNASINRKNYINSSEILTREKEKQLFSPNFRL